jgi:hypothetical protein
VTAILRMAVSIDEPSLLLGQEVVSVLLSSLEYILCSFFIAPSVNTSLVLLTCQNSRERVCGGSKKGTFFKDNMAALLMG